MTNFVHSALGAAIGWTLFHSLWEGAAVALLLAVALRVLRSSRARYRIACLAMLAILAVFSYTFVRVIPGAHASVQTLTGPGSYGGLDGAQHSIRPPGGFQAADFLPWLTPFWVAGVMLFDLRTLVSWMAARRLRQRGVCYAPDPWQQRVRQLSELLRLSAPVELLESSLATVPVVVGYLRPVILIPLGLLGGMPVQQIEAILLHELAHVRRRDYLVNLMQTVVEGFLFYHPAVWWISGIIRDERENCCDDLVVAMSGDAYEYACALSSLEQSRWTAHGAVVASTGGNLVKRIRRLLYPLEAPRAYLSPAVAVVIFTLTAALALTAWQAQPQDKPAANPYRKWIDEDAAYIATPEERAAFLRLNSDEEREYFIGQFWERRDPTPGTPENEFKEEHYRRIAWVNEHFGGAGLVGWKSDRGRIYIQYGPPDEIESHPKGGAYKRPAAEGGGEVQTYPFEQWLYRHIDGVGDNVMMEFVDKNWSGQYYMTTDPNPSGKYIPR